MKIQAVVLDMDQCYTKRISEWMKQKEMEITFAVCHTLDEAKQVLGNCEQSVILIAECMEDQAQEAEDICAAAYFTNETVSEKNGMPAIGKFQKGREIYDQIVHVIEAYKNNEEIRAKKRMKAFRTYSVISVLDLAGAKTVAAAMVEKQREHGKQVFVWNAKPGKSMKEYLPELKAGTLDEISKESIPGFLESNQLLEHVGKEQQLTELTPQQVREVAETVKQSCRYDAMVIVADCDTHKEYQEIYAVSDQILTVMKGLEGETAALDRTISLVDKSEIVQMENKCSILYNRFGEEDDLAQPESSCKVIGGFPQEQGSVQQLIEKFKGMAVFDGLMQMED